VNRDTKQLDVTLPAVDDQGPLTIRLTVSPNVSEEGAFRAVRDHCRKVGYPFTFESWSCAWFVDVETES
jgi:hypothetical protein